MGEFGQWDEPREEEVRCQTEAALRQKKEMLWRPFLSPSNVVLVFLSFEYQTGHECERI